MSVCLLKEVITLCEYMFGLYTEYIVYEYDYSTFKVTFVVIRFNMKYNLWHTYQQGMLMQIIA